MGSFRTTQALAWMCTNDPIGSWDEDDAVRFLQVFDRRCQEWVKDPLGPDREEVAQQTLFQFGQHRWEWSWPLERPELLPSETDPMLCWHDAGVSSDARPTCNQCGTAMVDGVPGLSVSYARQLWRELQRAHPDLIFPSEPFMEVDQRILDREAEYYEAAVAEAIEERVREEEEWERIVMEATAAPFVAEAERLADPHVQAQLARLAEHETGAGGWDESEVS